jgi:hypothetical protein
VAAPKGFAAVLGNWTNLPEAQAKGAAANRKTADAFAANVLPIVRQIQAAGATTFRAIAAALNDRGVRTARGGAWHDSTVRNLLARAGWSADANGIIIEAECKGGAIETRHPGRSKLDKSLCEIVGRLTSSPATGRQVAVMPRTEVTLRLAPRCGCRNWTARPLCAVPMGIARLQCGPGRSSAPLT